MITTKGNAIALTGTFEIGDFHRLLATIHDRIEKKGYQDVVLDFSGCTATFAGPIGAICAQACKFRHESIEFELILPEKENLRRLFINANWAHLIDPVRYEKSSFRGLRQVPITQFFTTEDQNTAVDAILDVVLGSLTGFTRSDLAAIEWSLNEITDNVINHSHSDVGGLLQLSTFKRNQKRIEYVVCDAGIGIPDSLRTGMSDITSDSQALDFAIREGLTRDKSSNQGNGLFGAFEISRVSEGYMEIHSGYASLQYNKKAGLHIRTEPIPFRGTLIVSSIDYSNPGLLGKALRFGGKPHLPVDFIETKFEDSSGNKVVFSMKDEASSFGSRKAAEPVSTKLQNLAALSGNYKIFVDFTDVFVISSSFADEVFGKLFVSMGPLAFIQKFEFMNLNDTVRSLIDRAITLRSSTKN
jgi:anti-sigma regulatory factor (Ser/Thr protein kinase)/anti-anti-sigma regulatory factor